MKTKHRLELDDGGRRWWVVAEHDGYNTAVSFTAKQKCAALKYIARRNQDIERAPE